MQLPISIHFVNEVQRNESTTKHQTGSGKVASCDYRKCARHPDTHRRKRWPAHGVARERQTAARPVRPFRAAERRNYGANTRAQSRRRKHIHTYTYPSNAGGTNVKKAIKGSSELKNKTLAQTFAPWPRGWECRTLNLQDSQAHVRRLRR